MDSHGNPLRIILILCASASVFLTSCSIHPSTGRLLKRLNLEYETDVDGDYRTTIQLENGREKVVGIGAHGIPLKDGRTIHEIWSVAARIPGSLPEGLAESLLSDTWSSALTGGWALAGETAEGRQVLVYVCRLPEDTSKKSFYAAIVDAANAASQMEEALSSLEN